jgi:hypothetical protein
MDAVDDLPHGMGRKANVHEGSACPSLPRDDRVNVSDALVRVIDDPPPSASTEFGLRLYS